MADSMVVMSETKPPAPSAFAKSHTVNARGQNIMTTTWLPFAGEAKGILLWHHGLAEHSSRYTHVFATVAAAGIAVYSYDCIGHGHSDPKSGPERTYFDNYTHLVDDYLFRLQQIQDEYKNQGKPLPPIFAGGGSMGGCISALAVAKKQQEFAGLVMVAPMVDVEWTPIMRVQAAFGTILTLLFPKAALVPAVRLPDLSQDPKAVQEYKDDKLNYVGNTKCKPANQLLKSMVQLRKVMPTLSLPVYITHGDSDKITSAPASKRFYDTIASTDKMYETVKGGYHMLLHGPEHVEVITKITKWLTDHLSGAAGASSGAAAGPAATDAAAPAVGAAATDAAAPAVGPAATDAAAPAVGAAATDAAAPAVGPAATDAAAAGAGAESTAAIIDTAQKIADQTAEVLQDIKLEDRPPQA